MRAFKENSKGSYMYLAVRDGLVPLVILAGIGSEEALSGALRYQCQLPRKPILGGDCTGDQASGANECCGPAVGVADSHHLVHLLVDGQTPMSADHRGEQRRLQEC